MVVNDIPDNVFRELESIRQDLQIALLRIVLIEKIQYKRIIVSGDVLDVDFTMTDITFVVVDHVRGYVLYDHSNNNDLLNMYVNNIYIGYEGYRDFKTCLKKNLHHFQLNPLSCSSTFKDICFVSELRSLFLQNKLLKMFNLEL